MNEAPALSATKPARTAAPPFLAEYSWDKIGLIAVVCCLVLLDGINGALVSTLRPYLMGSFAATPDQITWVAILYYVAKFYMLLLAARAQERFGQRRSLLFASVVLVLATAGGSLVTNYPSLLAITISQGIGGGLMIALGQGALLAAFPRREQSLVQCAFALAVVMFPATIVPALLGGFAYNYDWQDAYAWITVCGLIGCGWLFWKQKILSDISVSSPVPVVRIILMVTSLFAIVYVLQQGNRNAWLECPSIVWSLLLAAACLLGIGFAESNGGPTYLRYHCFQFANFTFGLSVSLLAGIALFGSGFVIPGFTGGILAYPVWQTGLVQLFAAAFTTLSLLIVGIAVRFAKIPGILFVPCGLILFGFAMWKLGEVPSNVHFEGLLPWLMVRGFAVGCLFLPLTLMTLTGLPPIDDVAGAGLFNFGRQLGALVGVAWMQTLNEHLTDRNQTVLGEALSWANPNALIFVQNAQDALVLHGTTSSQAPATAVALMLQEAQRQMSSVAYSGCFQALAMLFLFSFPILVLGRVLTARFLKPPYEAGSH